MTALNHPSIHHEQSLTLNTVALIFLFKEKSSPFSHKSLLQLPAHITTSLKMENSTFTLQLDRLFSIWNNAINCMNFWIPTTGTYRATAILSRYTAFSLPLFQ